MKVILFYPKPEKENTNMQLPLPVLSIASDLLKDNYSVEIIDERKEPGYARDLPNRLRDATAFGVSVMTGYQIKGGLAASRLVKSVDKKIPVVWGGWHVSMLPEETLRNPLVDIGVVGPGEGIMQEICRRAGLDIKLTGLGGAVYKDKWGRIIRNERGDSVGNMHSISKESMRLVDMSDYIHSTDLGASSIFWVTSKGCPYNCGFCCSAKVYGRQWRGMTAEKIVGDLQWLVDEYGINGVNFVDTNFFVDKNRVRFIAEELLQKKLNIKWAASARVDQVNMFDKDFLRLIKKSGCIKLFVGAESGSKEVLELIDKNINIEDTIRMADHLSKIDIIAEMYVMAGFPIDPVKDLNETLKLVKEVKMRYPNHQFTSFLYTPYPGTPLYNLAIQRGLKVPSRLEGWIDWNITEVMTPWVDKKRYGDKLHSFVKMYYPLAFPSENLKERFKDAWTGWAYRLLHRLELFRVENDFFYLPIEWEFIKFMMNLRARYKFLNRFGGVR